MPKFPVDVPKTRVIAALRRLEFEVVREKNHIFHAAAGIRRRIGMSDHSNHLTIKASTLRTIVTQAGITRDEFLDAYEQG